MHFVRKIRPRYIYILRQLTPDGSDSWKHSRFIKQPRGTYVTVDSSASFFVDMSSCILRKF